MNPLRVNFDELYRRHLRRHSQFGINVLHLIAVAGIYIALCGIVLSFPAAPWAMAAALGAYFAVLAFNVPLRLLLVNVACIGLLVLAALSLPEMSVWIHIGLIVFWHRFQVWNHRVYTKELDMSEFAAKYRKGPALAVLLAVYELPILLNFLVFGAANRKRIHDEHHCAA